MADPRTCLHRVVGCGTTEEYESFVECASCGTDLTERWKELEKDYEYDIDHNLWVYDPKHKGAFAQDTIDLVEKLKEDPNARPEHYSDEEWTTEPTDAQREKLGQVSFDS